MVLGTRMDKKLYSTLNPWEVVPHPTHKIVQHLEHMRCGPPPQSSETTVLSRIGSPWELRTRNYRGFERIFDPDAMEHLQDLKKTNVLKCFPKSSNMSGKRIVYVGHMQRAFLKSFRLFRTSFDYKLRFILKFYIIAYIIPHSYPLMGAVIYCKLPNLEDLHSGPAMSNR